MNTDCQTDSLKLNMDMMDNLSYKSTKAESGQNATGSKFVSQQVGRPLHETECGTYLTHVHVDRAKVR